MPCTVHWCWIRGSFEQFFATSSSHLWFETLAAAIPGNCGAELQCFWNSTDWFWEVSYFLIAAASTERLVETRTCLSSRLLVSILKDQVEELTRLRPRAFANSLGDKKGERTFNHVSNFIALRWRGFTSLWSNCCRLFRATSWSSTLIGWIYQFLQRLIATACSYCAKTNHTNGTIKARQFREIHSMV